jgi:hypothetical protein
MRFKAMLFWSLRALLSPEKWSPISQYPPSHTHVFSERKQGIRKHFLLKKVSSHESPIIETL